MDWKIIIVGILLVTSFAFALNDTVDVKVTKVVSNPRHIYPGTEDVSLTVTIVNQGTKTLKNTEAELDMPSDLERAYSGSDTYYVGTIMPDVPAMLQFDVSVEPDADEDELCIPLILTSGDEEIEDEICIDIESKPEVVLKSKSIPLMYNGGTFPVSVTVENKGEETAADVKVKLLISSSYPFTVKDNLEELGQLEEDEKATAVFEVFVDEDALSKEYKIEVQIRYTSDARHDENVYVESENIEFAVQSQQGMTGAFTVLANPWFAVIFGIVMIAVVAFVIKTKKR